MTTLAVLPMLVQEYTDDKTVAEVRELLRACGWQDNAIPSVDTLLESAMTGCAFVALREEKVIGFIRVVSDGETVSYITEIAVDASARFQGVGRALVDAVAREFPKARIDLLSTKLAQSFYEDLGFVNKPGYRRWPK